VQVAISSVCVRSSGALPLSFREKILRYAFRRNAQRQPP
jgi:hypothetical protein